MGPVVSIVVNHDGGLRVFQHITNTLEGFAGVTLGLLVHHKIDLLAIKRITEWNHMRLARGIRGRQAGNPVVIDETLNRLRNNERHRVGSLSRRCQRTGFVLLTTKRRLSLTV